MNELIMKERKRANRGRKTGKTIQRKSAKISESEIKARVDELVALLFEESETKKKERNKN